MNKIQSESRRLWLGSLALGLAASLASSGAWSESGAPKPTPHAKATPKVQRPPAKRRFLLAYQERLVFPETSKLDLPKQATGDMCQWEKKGKQWFVTGTKTGDLEFEWENTRWTIMVRERALKAPVEAGLTTFGDYPDLQALQHWARDFLHPLAELTSEPGVLTARGPDLIPYQFDVKAGHPKLATSQEEIAGQPSDGLILSNWPEKIERDQILLEAPLSGAKQWRVMVHHRNMPNQPPRFLEVEIVQPEQKPQRYVINSCLAGPSVDEIFVGHLAAIRFVKEFGGETPRGYITSVEGGSRHLLERSWIKPGQTVSAMLGIRALDLASTSGTLRVSVRTPDNQAPLEIQPFDRKARTARGVFASETVRELAYKVGPAYLFEEIGSKPYAREVVEDYASPGNFGMAYRYRWTLDNSSAQNQEVRMEMSARGGPARACIWIDGELVETDMLKAEPKLLRRWIVPAGTKLPVLMETFPQAGSNFPISLTLSSRPAAVGAAVSEAKSGRGWFIP